MNSNMVKHEKFGHLRLVYPFTVPLRDIICISVPASLKHSVKISSKHLEHEHIFFLVYNTPFG